MALQTSGAISLNDIHVEGGGTTQSLASLNESQIRKLIFKSAGVEMSFSEWYGAGRVNGLYALQEILISDYISSGETFTIPSGGWIWSNSNSTAALTINIPCTVINNGQIIGKGGAGGSTSSLNGTNGGTAINVISSGVSITNNSGAYIAGGGGGGAAAHYTNGSGTSGGGGGAGGGNGGTGNTYTGETGGAINSTGTGVFATNAGAGAAGGSSSGGRQLPGSGGTFTDNFANPSPNIGFGGNAGNSGGAGGLASAAVGNFITGGGGGGWGAAGGSTTAANGLAAASGGSGGAAITGTSITLNNNGIIYGST